MGICASSSKFSASTRAQILTPVSAFILFQNEESINLNVKRSRTYPPVSAAVVPLAEEKFFCTEYKSESDSNRQILRRQQKHQENFLPGGYNQKQPSDHQFPEFSSDSDEENWSPRPRQAREQSGFPSQLQNYRRLSSAFFEGDLLSDSNDHPTPTLPGFQNVPQGGFTKPAFRDFVENIPGSNSHRAVVLAEFEQLWSILSAGEDQIPLSRLLAFYNIEKSREEHNQKPVKTARCGNAKNKTNSDLNKSNNLSSGTLIVNMIRDNTRTGFNIQRDINGISKPGGLSTNQPRDRKIQTSINYKDGYQHQLTLGELDQTQFEDDGFEMTKRFSSDSSSTRTLSYPSTNMQLQIIEENLSDGEGIDESPSIKIFKPLLVSEPLRPCCSCETETMPETCLLKNVVQDVIQARTPTQPDSMDQEDVRFSYPDYSSKEEAEIFQDFVFLSGSRPMKRKRICGKRPTNHADRGQGYWEWFEDLDRVSNRGRGWRPNRQRRQNSLMQLRGLASTSPHVVDSKKIASACSQCDIPQYVGEDIVAALIAGEKLTTVDMLNRYGKAASIECLRRFYKWSCVYAVNEKTQLQHMA